jgi:hypothetical protein
MDALCVCTFTLVQICTCDDVSNWPIIGMYSCLITGLDSPLGLQEVEVPRISRQSEHECDKVVRSTHRLPLPPGDIPGTHFC